MSSILDSMIPSRRREQKRLREEANRLHERYGDFKISAPLEGCWNATDQRTPELGWSSPSTQGFASPSGASTFVHNSPELGDFGEPVVIVDTDADPSAQIYQEEVEKEAALIPWPSRKTTSRSPSISQGTLPTIDTLQRASPRASAASSSVVSRTTSDHYVEGLGGLSRGNSPAQSVVSSARHASPPPAIDLSVTQPYAMSSFSRRSPSPGEDQEEGGHNISAIMLLSPVGEDFPVRRSAASTFSRASSRNIEHFTRQLPSPPLERPSTTMSSYSTLARSEIGSSLSRATAVTDASYYTAITHHTTRSTSRGPGLAHTGTMRSASREPASRRAVSREPSERRALSRDPGSRRAVSREPTRRRAMTGESVIYRPAFEDLPHGASSGSGRTGIEGDYSDEPTLSEVGRKASNSSLSAGSYYSSMANEYRHIARDAPVPPPADSSSMVGRVGKLAKEKLKSKEPSPALPSKELVPSGEDLYW